MKPIDFMDALGDVSEVYVRQTLDEDAAETVPIRNGTQSISVNTGTGSRPEDAQITGAEKPFGGRLRYLALLASAAACIACIFGIMHLYPHSSENSFPTESVFTEILETQTVPAVTGTTDAGTVPPVTGTGTKNTTGTTAAVTVPPVTGTAPAETGQTVPASAAETQMSAETPRQQTTAKSETEAAVTTTEEPKSRAVPATIPESKINTAMMAPQWYEPYTQPYLLGDVDADGDITLVDFFLAYHEFFFRETQNPLDVTNAFLDDDAADRCNVDRLSKRKYSYDRENDQLSRITDLDLSYILYTAMFRAWLGFPDVTVPDLLYVYYNEDGLTGCAGDRVENLFEYRCSVFETQVNDRGFTDLNESRIVGDMVPEAVREFYNDAMVWVQNPEAKIGMRRFHTWSDAEFAQKMDELRALLAEN